MRHEIAPPRSSRVPTQAAVLFRSANGLRRSGRLFEALATYDRAIAAWPRFFEALYNRSAVLGELGRLDEALAANEEAGRLQPHHVGLLHNRAALLSKLQLFEAALLTYDRILANQPDDLTALRGRAYSLASIGCFEEALVSFETFLQLAPANLAAQQGIASVKLALGRHEEAKTILDDIVRRAPRAVEAWVLRGDALNHLSRPTEAFASYSNALRLDSTNKPARYNRAGVLRNIGRHAEAAEEFRRLRRADPSFRLTLGNELYCRLNCCDWSDYADLVDSIMQMTDAGQTVCAPFDMIGICRIGALQLRASEAQARRRPSRHTEALWNGGRYQHPKVRIAYLSADFRQHAVAQIAVRLFELHDRSQFELYAFALKPSDQSPLGRRVAAAFDHFIEVPEVADRQAAQIIRDAEIDILIDLSGHAANSRPGILAHRPAPLQINFLGYSATMGTPSHDVIIADQIAIPPEHCGNFSEEVARMPRSFFPSDDTRTIADDAGTRAAAGLPEDGVVFCNFGSAFKITPPVFDVWMRILHQIEGSVLWLSQMTQQARTNLRHAAEVRDVDPSRLIFAERISDPARHLARHRLADVFLDTWPYNAHVTANDALQAGLPVVAWLGDTFASRIAGSQIMALGMPELVGRGQEDYERIALRLARDGEWRAHMKVKLVHNSAREPLFDMNLYVRDYERLVLDLHHKRSVD